MLKAAGVTSVKLEEKLPFLGALLKKEQDLVAFAEAFGRGARGASLSGRSAHVHARSSTSCGGARCRSARRRRVALAEALTRRAARQLARRLLLRGARAAACTPRRTSTRSTRPSSRTSRASRAGRMELDGGAARVAAGRRRSAAASSRAEEQRAARAARPRGAAGAVRGAAARAEGAPRRRQPVDRHRRHVALRHTAGRGAARASASGGDGRKRAARCRSADARRYRGYRDDLVLDTRQIGRRAAQAARLRARGRARRARPRRHHRRDREERRRARGGDCARRAGRTRA